jgi:hypothetical protein
MNSSAAQLTLFKQRVYATPCVGEVVVMCVYCDHVAETRRRFADGTVEPRCREHAALVGDYKSRNAAKCFRVLGHHRRRL